jgi:hypothetical protein
VPKVNATQRRARDAVILGEFLAGASYREIGRNPRVNLSAQGVANVVNGALSDGAERTDLLREYAPVIYAERLETLLCAVWEPALAGNHRAIELALRILDQQGRLYRLNDRLNAVRTASDIDGELQDELARYRARFRTPEV